MKNKKTFCKACKEPTKYGNEFCTPEEGRNFYEKETFINTCKF